MGIDINLERWSIPELIRVVNERSQHEDYMLGVDELLDVLASKGQIVIAGDEFYLLNNEYYDDYNPAWIIPTFFTAYYNLKEPDDWFMFYSVYSTIYDSGSVDLSEIYDWLNLSQELRKTFDERIEEKIY